MGEQVYSVKAKSYRYDENTKRPKPQITPIGILNIYAFCWKIKHRAQEKTLLWLRICL